MPGDVITFATIFELPNYRGGPDAPLLFAYPLHLQHTLRRKIAHQIHN